MYEVMKKYNPSAQVASQPAMQLLTVTQIFAI